MINGMAKIEDRTGAVAAATRYELPTTSPNRMPSVQAITIATPISVTVIKNARRNTAPSVFAARKTSLGAARMMGLTSPDRTISSHAVSAAAAVSLGLH